MNIFSCVFHEEIVTLVTFASLIRACFRKESSFATLRIHCAAIVVGAVVAILGIIFIMNKI